MNNKLSDTIRLLCASSLTKAKKNAGYIFVLSLMIVIVGIGTYFGFVETNGFRQINVEEFAVGKVADRDVSTTREVSYIDEEATQIRREARKNLVPAVLRLDKNITISTQENFAAFIRFTEVLFQNALSVDQFILQMQQQYPGYFERSAIVSVYDLKERKSFLTFISTLFKQLTNEGIAEFPDRGMESFNKAEVEVLGLIHDKSDRQIIPIQSLLLKNEIPNRIQTSVRAASRPESHSFLAYSFMKPFLKTNLVYQSEESESKLEAALKQVPPVLVVLERGKKIIKRGFLITEENYKNLAGLAKSGVFVDLRKFTGTILFLIILLVVSVFIFSQSILERKITVKDTIVLSSFFSIQYFIVLIASRIFFAEALSMSMILPAAVFSMLVTVLIDQKTAIFITIISALGALGASGFMFIPFLYVLFSGITGIAVIKVTGKRIDLVKSACMLALFNPLLLLIINSIQSTPSNDFSQLIIGGAMNGFMSGILVLGFLPILESLLNTCTDFRLMEFSDLNSPIMKKMLLSVSGTYNHSIMVATLSESACRAIGADPLLARVGAYYHDIGKIDQSDYFVENQVSYNKHLDINPRLSATVIRSHVKQGVERARQMRLPSEVIDIISEHHGNSLISYFYNEEKKHNNDVNPEDFTYPGNPPRSKESAVVMLADVVEAACRSLDKPSATRLEKFISELISNKISTNQLDSCDLTFKDVGIIQKTFVNILAGYYHTRIEYHGQKDMFEHENILKESAIKGKL